MSRLNSVKYVEEGFFLGTHIEYIIETYPQNWRVLRRFNNFRQLRDSFLKLYPGYIVNFIKIPPIHSMKKSSTDAKFINKRKNFLQKFLDEISTNAVLKTTNEFKAFLSYTTSKEFEKLIEESKKRQINDVKDTKNIDGNVI